MAKIFVAGLNPAWQQIFTLDSLREDAVNRATGFVELASGKGMNVAKVLAARGHEVSLWQVLAGGRGRAIEAACARAGIRSLHEYTSGETRVCATLVASGKTTEIIAPFSTVDDVSLASRLLDRLPAERFDALLVCGTVPSGLEEGGVGVMDSLCARVGAELVLWDSVAGLSPRTLPRVDWLKVNAEEHRALAPALAASRATPSLLITDGPRPALVAPRGGEAGNGAALCALPPLDAVVNPIGAGDTVTAMLADGLLRGLDARAASARALAAAAASCLNVLPAVWDDAVAARLEAGVRWRPAEAA